MSDTTRHGLGILAAVLAACLFLNAVVAHTGLKYVQGVIWPTDIPAFVQLPPAPVDVAVFGSSRASFGLPPSALDGCLSEALGRPTRSVNLAQTFATAYDAEVIYRELLGGAVTPKVLVLAAGPEFFDEYNHQLSAGLAAHAELSELPENLAYARGLSDVYAALYPLGRGVESTALYLSGRYDTQARLTWLMIHYGGGQFCYGSEPCKHQNRAYQQLLADRWDAVVAQTIPTLRADRFERFALGVGQVHRRLLSLLALARARGTRVLIVLMPLNEIFQAQIPQSVQRDLSAYVRGLAEAEGLTVFDGNSHQYREQRRWFVDPDHLNAKGARRLSKSVCRKALVPLLSGEPG